MYIICYQNLSKYLNIIQVKTLKTQVIRILPSRIDFFWISLVIFSCIFFILINSAACFFVIIAQIEYRNLINTTWIVEKDIDNHLWVTYLNGLYFLTTTILTIGYGDIVVKTFRKKKKEEIFININADNKDKNSKNEYDNVIVKNLNNIVNHNVTNTFSTQEENSIIKKIKPIKRKIKRYKNALLKKIVNSIRKCRRWEQVWN